jgi:hypothetical protein
VKKSALFIVLILIIVTPATYAGFFEDMFKSVSGGTQSDEIDEIDDDTIASGLREALSIGTENAVKNVSQKDGYFGNEAIKILIPEKVRVVTDVLSTIGYQEQVDDFVLSMNRAAEKAAPEALSIFVDAIKEMTFEDARNILNGGDTAATDFFKDKTQGKIYDSFKPIIETSMDEVGVTRSYKEMMGKYEILPFAQTVMKEETVDIDHYVTTKAVDGLFYVVGQEEKKIRTDPAARITELLKDVFGQ